MTRRLLVLALLGVAAVAAPARAATYTVDVPTGCTVSVWSPDIAVQTLGLIPHITTSGDTGATTDCP